MRNLAVRKSLLAFLAAFVLLVVCFVAPACAAPSGPVREMVLDRDAVCVPLGGTFLLKLTTRPWDAKKYVTWASSDEAVATVSEGTVTGRGLGTAVITVTSTQDASFSCSAQITVVTPVESITVRDENLVLPPNAVWEQVAFVLPEEATVKQLQWSTNNRKVATVDDQGVITAVGIGNCVITCTAMDDTGVKALTHVRVKKHDYIISEPDVFETDFEMVEDEGVNEITGEDKKVTKDMWQKTVRIDNGRLEKVNDTRLRPLAAGSETVHLLEIHTKKDKNKDIAYTFFIEQNAVRAAGSVPGQNTEGEILFRDIPWGSRYKEVKALLSARKEKLKPLAVRNQLLWTQIDGEIAFGNFTAFRNGLSFSSASANVDNLTANLQKTSFCMGDYYFDKSIPFENLKQNVMRTYGLPENETTSSDADCTWQSGDVTVHLFATSKYTQLKISWEQPQSDAVPPSEEDAEEASVEESD